jgi:hypothetical protein
MTIDPEVIKRQIKEEAKKLVSEEDKKWKR